MNAKDKSIRPNQPDLQLAFDVGHSSIGWAVLQKCAGKDIEQLINILGCGAVVFQADDCLTSTRRDYRRQRRHIRSTRQRIARLKTVIENLGALNRKQLDQPGCAWPWMLAADALSGKHLSWPELWNVLRWYAHNRGYDGNRRWSGHEAAASEDVEKINNARALYAKHGTATMAETVCCALGLKAGGEVKASRFRYKDLNAAFPREDVETEVRQILELHFGKLLGVNEAFVRALFDEWRAIPCPNLRLPMRYRGGLLFGQLVPRFENRIIATCPVMFERAYTEALAKTGDPDKAKRQAKKVSKVPGRECPEFYRFRWAIQLANVQVAVNGARMTRSLNLNERKAVDAEMQRRGHLTPKEFKSAVRAATNAAADNLDQMLMHPDVQKALVLDPVKKLVHGHAALAALWPSLPAQAQTRATGKWRRGKAQSLGELISGAGEGYRTDLELAAVNVSG